VRVTAITRIFARSCSCKRNDFTWAIRNLPSFQTLHQAIRFLEVVQVAGRAYRISAGKLAQLLKSSAEARELVNHHVALLAMRIAQVAGCNPLHKAEQRLARWLLVVNDQAQTTVLPITQKRISILLGITRQRVSETANVLRRKGAIKLRGRRRARGRDGCQGCADGCARVSVRGPGQVGGWSLFSVRIRIPRPALTG
jgi:hypothetical protein